MLPYTFQKVMMAELRYAGYNEAKALPGQYIQPAPILPITITDTDLTVPKGFAVTPDISQLLLELKPIHKLASEATWLFENTQYMRTKGFEHHKLFAKYMNTLLSAHMPDNGEPEYCIRLKHDRTLIPDCRTSSYLDAKVRFLTLSPILNNVPVFDTRNINQMYHALVYRGLHDSDMQAAESGMVRNAITAIEQAFPGFAEGLREPAPSPALETETEAEQ